MSSSVISSMGPTRLMPALLTRMSSPPSPSAASSTARLIDAGSSADICTRDGVATDAT